MSIHYRLTLAGDIPLERVAQLIPAEATEVPAPGGDRVLSADLDDEYGYVLTLTSGVHGYYEAEADGIMWQWEPETYVDVTFHMNKDLLTDLGRPRMLRNVAEILASTTEDAALILDDNWLLLTRSGGRLQKHNTADWDDGELFDSRSD
ncbi:SitI3 family protein [Plantactinospora sp. B5E13]|uniref:SitI3 family protein n=1 Tax=unclassified Plantactinospora TaxID=2631981 RepID=UPI00325E42B5